MITRSFYFLRHGETDWNISGQVQGQLDIPLNDTGRAQAAETISCFSGLNLAAIVSSDLGRARETAEIVNASLGLPLFLEPGLRERIFGVMQGLGRGEIEARIAAGEVMEYGPPDVEGFSCPLGAEPLPVVEARVIAAIVHWQAMLDGPILFVAHGGPYRALQRTLFGKTISSPNAVPVHYDYIDGQWQLETLLRPDSTSIPRKLYHVKDLN